MSYFHHVFIDNNQSKTLFLLHGTGGDERDLLPLVEQLSDQYNFVGLKGNVSEQGLTRFFERNERGVFDQDSIKKETKKLAQFLQEWYQAHELTAEQTAFVGYSNGANMILAMLFYYPELISKAVVMHGKLPFEPSDLDLIGKHLLLTYGFYDKLIPAQETLHAVERLKELGAKLEVAKHDGGHEVKRLEVETMHSFLLL